MRESSLDQQIRKRALARGAYHKKLSGTVGQAGLPDHLIGYRGRFIFLEAKVDTDLSPLQRREMRLAQGAGNIAEKCYSATLVDVIFDCIDNGDTWHNGQY